MKVSLLQINKFSLLKVYKKQNHKSYAKTFNSAKNVIPRVQRDRHPAAELVWWGVFVKTLHFCGIVVKTGAKVYQQNVLDGMENKLSNTLFDRELWIF